MLEREEDAALAEIEAALRRDDPAFVALIETLDHDQTLPPVVVHGVPAVEVDIDDSQLPVWLFVDEAPIPPRRAVVVLQSVASVLLAIVLTGLTTIVAGPNVGGLVGVLSITIASLATYQRLRGCPGRLNR